MEKSRRCLPEEMLVEILLKLPVKSLGQFRSVCKSWYQIISSTSSIHAKKDTSPNTNCPYLLCDHTRFYSVLCNQELTSPNTNSPYLRIKVYKNCQAFSRPELPTNLGMGIKVHGSCKGLLWVSEKQLQVNSIIYLLNPTIRKAKRIPNISIGGQVQIGDVDLCLGYFDDDYKLIKIVVSSRGYTVGFYSLRTDCWKTNNDADDHMLLYYPKNARFINGVAYFSKAYYGGIVSFDLCDERIREIMLPQNIDQSDKNTYTSYDLEVYRESIAFVGINKGVIDIWVLNICGITKTSTWEKKVISGLGPAAHSYPVGFLNNDTYFLRSSRSQSGIFYLCNLENLECKRFIDKGEQGHLSRIDSFVGNLVLLNEENIDPFVETAPYSACKDFLVYINCEKITAQKKGKNERLHKRHDKLEQGRYKKKGRWKRQRWRRNKVIIIKTFSGFMEAVSKNIWGTLHSDGDFCNVFQLIYIPSK